MDFKLSPADHPVPLTDTQGKLSPGVFWYEVGNMKALDGDLHFPLLARLMAGLLSIPVSNDDSEKGFSILRKIHTDQRPTLKQSTIISLMAIKFNSEECCHNASFTDKLLSKCKKATSVSLSRE